VRITVTKRVTLREIVSQFAAPCGLARALHSHVPEYRSKGVGMGRDHDCDAARAPTALYVNYFEVSHSALEFILDLGQYQPEAAASRLHTRLVTGPVYAKMLSRMLQTAIREYETAHGVIDDLRDDIDPFEVVKNSIDFDRPVRKRRQS
jgi:hypothetical protein